MLQTRLARVTSWQKSRHVVTTYVHEDQISTLCKHTMKHDRRGNVLARMISCPDLDLLAKQINRAKMEDMRIFLQEKEEAETPGARTPSLPRSRHESQGQSGV